MTFLVSCAYTWLELRGPRGRRVEPAAPRRGRRRPQRNSARRLEQFINNYSLKKKLKLEKS